MSGMLRFSLPMSGQIRSHLWNNRSACLGSSGFVLKRLLSQTKKPNNIPLKIDLDKKVSVTDRFTPEERATAAKLRLDGLGPFVSRLPAKWIPYAELLRLEKPVGSALLYIPCTWAILIAATSTAAPLVTTVSTLAIFGVGSVIMRGFGCIVNDYLDKNYDDKVLRTIERPIASGRVSEKQALWFMAGNLGVGLVVILTLPWECFILGAASLVPVCTYPLFKRFTYYPQAVLSLAFNWGALLGFPAMGIWDINTMIPLFLSSFCWTMTYDTIYAHQDKKFDIDAGVKSTALAWGSHSKKIFAGLTVTQLSLLATAGYSAGILLNPGFLIGSGIFSYKLVKMIKDVDLDDPRSCWNAFLGNINTGFFFTAGLLFDYILMCLGWL